jgi:hypothetical protein
VIVCKLPGSTPDSVDVARVRFVSGNYFSALGITPEIGRSSDGEHGAVAMVSHDFWKNRLHADPGIYGKALGIPGGSLYILGVVPDKFSGTGVPPQTPDVWIPASAQTLVMPGVDWIHDDGVREWQVLGVVVLA